MITVQPYFYYLQITYLILQYKLPFHQPLSTFPFISILPKRNVPYCGESALSKRSWTQEKKVDPLRCANPRKSGTAPLRKALFYLSPPDLNFFHVSFSNRVLHYFVKHLILKNLILPLYAVNSNT
jgi:hypothetical protein